MESGADIRVVQVLGHSSLCRPLRSTRTSTNGTCVSRWRIPSPQREGLTLRSSRILHCFSLTLSWVVESVAQTEFQRKPTSSRGGVWTASPRCASQILAPSPGVVFVHEGGFQVGTRDSAPVTQFLDALAAAGIPSASIPYRLSMTGRGFGCDVPVADKRRAVALSGRGSRRRPDLAQRRTTRPKGLALSWVAAGSSAGAGGPVVRICARPRPVGRGPEFFRCPRRLNPSPFHCPAPARRSWAMRRAGALRR